LSTKPNAEVIMPEQRQGEAPDPPPRRSMFRLSTATVPDKDPRAAYTRALVNMGRAGDVAHLLAPSEILEAFCEAVAEPLELAVAVAIDAPDGLPRSMPWKASDADWRLLEHAERRAWSSFAELLAPDLLSVLPPETTVPGSFVHWNVQPLAVPLLGILQCGSRRPLGGTDHGLLKCMSVRLSTALSRARSDDEPHGPRSGR
jgi:hypothetical protein